MNRPITLVSDALEYYDANFEKYNDKLQQIRYVKFSDATADMDRNLIYLYDENKKLLAQSRYEIIGLYSGVTDTWTWAWSIASFRKNTTYISRKILNYGTELDPDQKFLKTELVTSRFRIADNIQLDIHAAIAAYLSKQPIVYKYHTYISEAMKVSSDGLIDILPEVEQAKSYTTYYMFLLDFKDEFWTNKP